MKTAPLSLLFTALVLAFLNTAQAQTQERIYELRTYVTNKGKLDTLLARFRDNTCRIFEKYGIQNIGYWVPVAKADGADNTLIYIVAHPDRAAAKTAWAAFRADPEWQAARAASEASGKILAQTPGSIFMTMTDFSPVLKTGINKPSRLFEMRTYTTPEAKLPDLHARFQNHTINLFTKHGMRHIAYWTPVDEDKGAKNKLIYILSHASTEAGAASFAAFRADPAWLKAKSESEANGSLTMPQPEGVKSIYLRATDFSPIQ
jgi:hypothetical protein